MKKSKLWIPVLIFSFLTLSLSCSDDDDDDDAIGDWMKTTPFKGNPRSGAVSFTIGTKVFVGLGYDGDEYLSDFYVFDITKGYWDEVDDFKGTLRERAVGFSLDGKGYVGLGYNADLNDEAMADFWRLDPDAPEGQQWTRVKDFGGGARYSAVGFSIGSNGYVGTGYDGDKYNGDFWRYTATGGDSTEGKWEEINSYPGEKIESGLAFVINDKAYICTGRNNDAYTTDFWQFDPTGSETIWTKLTPDDEEDYYDDFYSAVRRHEAVVVTLDNKAYIIGGKESTSTYVTDVYAYDATTQVWEDRTFFEGSARSVAIAYVLDGRIFYGTGQNGSSRYDDIWEFRPNDDYDEEY